MVFHLSSSLKVRNPANYEGSRLEVHLQQIGFTPEQYQTFSSFYNSLNPVTMPLIISLLFLLTQHTLIINFSLPFSSWILDSGATDHICSSLTHFTSYHQINSISVKLPKEIKSLQIILKEFSSVTIMS